MMLVGRCVVWKTTLVVVVFDSFYVAVWWRDSISFACFTAEVEDAKKWRDLLHTLRRHNSHKPEKKPPVWISNAMKVFTCVSNLIVAYSEYDLILIKKKINCCLHGSILFRTRSHPVLFGNVAVDVWVLGVSPSHHHISWPQDTISRYTGFHGSFSVFGLTWICLSLIGGRLKGPQVMNTSLLFYKMETIFTSLINLINVQMCHSADWVSENYSPTWVLTALPRHLQHLFLLLKEYFAVRELHGEEFLLSLQRLSFPGYCSYLSSF